MKRPEEASLKSKERSKNKRSARSGGAKPGLRKSRQDERQEEGWERFPIVGVGASAGGLEAISDLVKRLPRKTGMALVVVQHLDPGRESGLSEILSKVSSLPVKLAANNG